MAAYFIQTSRKLESILRGDVETSWIGELKTLAFWRACAAEFLGTMLFVFIGCSSVTATAGAEMDPSRIVQVGLAFGLGIMAMVMLTGHISGGHINPAVSIGFAVTLAISPIKAIFYCVSQTVGGMVGAGILYAVTDSARRGNMGANTVNPAISPAQGFGYEVIITFILVSVIMATTDGKRTSFAGVGMEIGLTVGLCHLAGIKYTGASMNPARSFGSAVAGGEWSNHWVYWAGTILGGLLASLVFQRYVYWAGPILGGVLAALVYKYILNPYRGPSTIEEALKVIECEKVQEKSNDHELQVSTTNNP